MRTRLSAVGCRLSAVGPATDQRWHGRTPQCIDLVSAPNPKPIIRNPKSRSLSSLIPLSLLLLLPACGYYSFTGATIPTHLSTVSIPLVEDRSVSIADDLDERMTRLLATRFVGQTRLRLETDEEEADAVLYAQIERVSVQPAAVGGDDRAMQNRVTVSVRAEYRDRVQDREILQRSFSGSANYDPTAGDEREAEIAAIVLALEGIADDIFTAATSNW